MKTFRKHWLAVCATLLAFVMCFSVIFGNHTRHVFTIADSSVSDGSDDGEDDYEDLGERGVDYFLPEDEVEEAVRTDLVDKIFPNGEIEVDEDLTHKPGFKNCPEENDFAVKCRTSTDVLVFSTLYIECEFNTVDMEFNCTLECDGDSYPIQTEAYVYTDDGSLGATLELEGEEAPYYVGDYKYNNAKFNELLQQVNDFRNSYYENEDLSSTSSSIAQPTGWISNLFHWMPKAIKIAIVVYVIVAETAEQIRAEINYTENQKRDSNIKLGTYIIRQGDSLWADYDFGFAKFGRVGCAPASAYNLKIAIGDPEMLSDTIYKFEKWGIEFAFGWGHCGSNPKVLHRYFKKEGIGYSKCINRSLFSYSTNFTKRSHFIMASWNDNYQGAHTFYVHKDTTQPLPFTGYNYYRSGNGHKKTIQEFYGEEFIVGYVIHGKK